MALQVAEPKVTKQYVEKRIRDWKKRVNDLYSTIESWISNSDYTLLDGPKLSMYEEMMSRFNIPATMIGTADIYKDEDFILTIKPKGLWVIGANGRIDILTLKDNCLLVDFAEQFERPQWKLFKGDKKKGVEFSKKEFLNLLK